MVSVFTVLWLTAAGHSEVGGARLKFEENKGQWPEHVLFRARVPNGSVFIESTGLTFYLESPEDNEKIGLLKHGVYEAFPDTFHTHVFRLKFVGASHPKDIVAGSEFPDYVNYYLGSDPSLWASGIRQFAEVVLKDIYPGIDVRFYSQGFDLKYEFMLSPQAAHEAIRMELEGLDDVKLAFGNLLMSTSVQQVVDEKPVAWRVKNGDTTTVGSRFVVRKTSGANPLVGFEVDRHPGDSLVIDPTLIFSTYTGSTMNNWGATATYDSLGNMYVGGMVLMGAGSSTLNGYPTTTGAFQTSFAGGSSGSCSGTVQTDMVISKFNATGSTLLYSTYLGGSGNEMPHSLVVNANNQLYVLGTTSSNNFPTTSGAYDATFNGGLTVCGGGSNNQISNSIPYPLGSDIVVVKFNAGGTALLGSTYIGGSGNDGISLSDTLQKAYCDEFRGEIIVDANDNCYVATSTASADFPVSNSFQTVYGGGTTDGVVFKFNSTLTSLLWSSFIGGSEADAAYSLQFDPSFNVFITGGTMSNDFPTTNNVIHPTYGGNVDGWVAKISNNGQTLLASTYLGTSAYDQSFFVQLDFSGNVYCVGQTLGSYPITPTSVYNNPNSGQFLHKLTNNLQSTVFSTRWGSGNGNINLSLTAFLVNECNHIFVSGWGGSLFAVGAPTSSATTTSGLPITNNAVQTTTDGSDFYFVVFEENATQLLFASYYGGNGGTAEHTDGGTSRFDKRGIIYQSACASCGSNSSFPTTNGVYAATKPTSAYCNLAALKYDLVTLIAEADINGPDHVCINDSIEFLNESFGGSEFKWYFGDGDSSDLFEPLHAYSQAGVYYVTLIIYDSVSCVATDTDIIELTVIPGPVGHVQPVPRVCPGQTVQLSASGGTSYVWSPPNKVSDPSIANPTAVINDTITFTVSVIDSCGTDQVSVKVFTHPDKTGVMPDTSICEGRSGELRSWGGTSYQWSPGIFLSGRNVPNPTTEPDSTVTYSIVILDSFGCEREHDLTVFVDGYVPRVKAWGDTSICAGERVLLKAEATDDYLWIPSKWVSDPTLKITPAYPEESITYAVRTTNSCGEAFDTVRIGVSSVDLRVMPDTLVCAGDSVTLVASGASFYQWSGPGFRQPGRNSVARVLPDTSSWYRVTGLNDIFCEKEDSVFVAVKPLPQASIEKVSQTIEGLDNALLIAHASDQVRWHSTGYVPCSYCDTIAVYPLYPTTYYLTVTDSVGCTMTDSAELKALSVLNVPTAFTPNGDGINEEFRVKGFNIIKFHMVIRDRWGRVVYESTDLQAGWNGHWMNTGNPCPSGAYVVDVHYTVLPDLDLNHTDRVILIR
ncbi:MAG: hypothetical protein Kow0075_01400 [Salibacteraceae bacterium]